MRDTQFSDFKARAWFWIIIGAALIAQTFVVREPTVWIVMMTIVGWSTFWHGVIEVRDVWAARNVARDLANLHAAYGEKPA
jgi:hypothetical protein